MSFSPVAGIQWVETCISSMSSLTYSHISFSPVAGIQWVETNADDLYAAIVAAKFQSRCRDSVG